MLSENLQELLSAYVDGELSPTEYERVMAALRESEIARQYVNSLRTMSTQLKVMPTYPCPPEIAQNILKSRQKARTQSSYARLSWGIGLAAAVLIGLGTWWYLTSQPGNVMPVINNNNIARNDHVVPVPTNPIPHIPARPQWDLARLTLLLQAAMTSANDSLDAIQDRLANSVVWLTEADAVREGRFLESQASLLTSPVQQTGTVFKSIEATLPLHIAPAEFQFAAMQTRLQKKGAFVLDITTKNASKTLARLMETTKLPLVVDDEVKQNVARKQPATVMLYIDNITVEQLNTWLTGMQSADYWNVPEYRTDGTCKSLLLYHLEPAGYAQVARSLGLTTGKWLENKAGTKPAPALALTYQANRKPTTLSKDAQQTIANLKGPGKDSITLVVMLRAEK